MSNAESNVEEAGVEGSSESPSAETPDTELPAFTPDEYDDDACGCFDSLEPDPIADETAPPGASVMFQALADSSEAQLVESASPGAPHVVAKGSPELPPGFIGTTKAIADKHKGGLAFTSMRRDLKESYLSVLNKVHALGGILTSSDGLRGLNAPVTAGRSRTSLHYTGRAIDLFILTGMRAETDRYLVAPDGGTTARPEWHVYCQSIDPRVDDPDFDASLIIEGELEYAVWRSKTGFVTRRRTLQYFSLTSVLAAAGWERIPSRQDWRTQYMSVEWWHFQNQSDLVVGQSRLGEELRKAWPAAQVQTSGLKLDAVWTGRGFA